MVWVTGRVRGEHLAVLLGTKSLTVILASEPLAWTILHKAHREDHRRGPRNTAARSRRLVWIVSATRLAKSVNGRCFQCRYKDRKLEKQLMGQLPQERLEVNTPFRGNGPGPVWSFLGQGRSKRTTEIQMLGSCLCVYGSESCLPAAVPRL